MRLFLIALLIAISYAQTDDEKSVAQAVCQPDGKAVGEKCEGCTRVYVGTWADTCEGCTKKRHYGNLHDGDFCIVQVKDRTNQCGMHDDTDMVCKGPAEARIGYASHQFSHGTGWSSSSSGSGMVKRGSRRVGRNTYFKMYRFGTKIKRDHEEEDSGDSDYDAGSPIEEIVVTTTPTPKFPVPEKMLDGKILTGECDPEKPADCLSRDCRYDRSADVPSGYVCIERYPDGTECEHHSDCVNLLCDNGKCSHEEGRAHCNELKLLDWMADNIPHFYGRCNAFVKDPNGLHDSCRCFEGVSDEWMKNNLNCIWNESEHRVSLYSMLRMCNRAACTDNNYLAKQESGKTCREMSYMCGASHSYIEEHCRATCKRCYAGEDRHGVKCNADFIDSEGRGCSDYESQNLCTAYGEYGSGMEVAMKDFINADGETGWVCPKCGCSFDEFSYAPSPGSGKSVPGFQYANRGKYGSCWYPQDLEVKWGTSLGACAKLCTDNSKCEWFKFTSKDGQCKPLGMCGFDKEELDDMDLYKKFSPDSSSATENMALGRSMYQIEAAIGHSHSEKLVGQDDDWGESECTSDSDCADSMCCTNDDECVYKSWAKQNGYCQTDEASLGINNARLRKANRALREALKSLN